MDSLSTDSQSLHQSKTNSKKTYWRPEIDKGEEKSAFKGFAKEITAHGVKYAVSEDSSKFRRVAWLLAVLGALTYLTVQLVTLILDYYSYPFTTVSRITPASVIPFPTMTICDLNHLDTTRLNNSDDIKTVFRVFEGGIWANFINKTTDDLRQEEPYKSILNTRYNDLLDKYPPDYTQLFPYCSWEGEAVDCARHLKYFDHPVGRCYKINYNMSEAKMSSRPGSKAGFNIVIKVKPQSYASSESNGAGVKVLLHDMFDWPDMFSKGLLFSPGFIYDIAFHKYTHQFLPYPYHSLGDDVYCTDSTPKEFGGQHGKGFYATTACILSHSKLATIRTCNCSAENCTVDQYLSCYKPTLFKIYDQATIENSFDCAIPCSRQSFDPIISQAFFPIPDAKGALRKLDPALVNDEEIRLSYLSLNMYFEDLIVRESEHIPEYDSLTILGTVGGNMGLFLGASVLTVMELIDFILFMLWHAGRKLGCKYGLRVHDKNGSEMKSAQ